MDTPVDIHKDISKEPINILFGSSITSKKDVWEIDLIRILDLLIKILERSGKTDLKVAGMAALSSSLIYSMKVDSIFDLHKVAMQKKPLRQQSNVEIPMLEIPYRHESTYPVSLDDLMGLLQNLINTIANPGKKARGRIDIEPIPVPEFKEYMMSLDGVIGRYQDLLIRKISVTGSALLQEIIFDLDVTDSIRCFFAALFLARDHKVDLVQEGDNIRIITLDNTHKVSLGEKEE